MKKNIFVLCALMALSSFVFAAPSDNVEDHADVGHHPVQRIYNLRPSAGSRSYHWAMIKHHQAMQDHHAEEEKIFQSALLKNQPIPHASLPAFVDLRAQMSPCYDQGQLGSCTGNACAGLIENAQIRAGISTPIIPARLALYYHARYLEGTVNQDSGATITDIIQAMAFGIPPESEWPYTNYQSMFTTQPSPICYKDGISLFDKEQISYTNVPQNEASLKQTLASGRGVMIGIQVHDGVHGLESETAARTGMVEMPAPGAGVLGGHAVLLVGYDDRNTINDKGGHSVANPLKGRYIVRNSWGKNWGANGYFFLPQAFVHNPNYAYDFWTIDRLVNPSKTLSIQQSIEETCAFFKPELTA